MSPQPRRRSRLEYATVLGLPAAIAIVVLAQVLEGAAVGSLWQPTAALVVFGGTLVATLVRYPLQLIRRTGTAVLEAFVSVEESAEAVLHQILQYSHLSRRKGVIALDAEVDRAPDPFMREALVLASDNTNSRMLRQVLELESE